MIYEKKFEKGSLKIDSKDTNFKSDSVIQFKHNPEVKSSFQHWVRMTRWMMKYDGEYKKPTKQGIFFGFLSDYILKMEKEIHDAPFSENCLLCHKYLKNNCKGCPLVNCDDSIYSEIINAETKELWIKNAKKLIAKLFSLRWYDERQ